MKQNNKIGKIMVSTFILETGILPEAFHKIEFSVMRCEHLSYKNQFEYYGTSPQFEEIEIGVETPTYDLIHHTNESYEVKRLKS